MATSLKVDRLAPLVLSCNQTQAAAIGTALRPSPNRVGAVLASESNPRRSVSAYSYTQFDPDILILALADPQVVAEYVPLGS
jgi:hypothetical protein